MHMDSHYYDGIPCFYSHDAAPPASPELVPFVLDASPLLVEPPPCTMEAPSGSAFHDYYDDAAPAGWPQVMITAGAQQRSGGQNVHRRGIDALGKMEEVDPDQWQAREEEEEERRQPAGAAVESSRGFRHMMRERQRREKLSQSYADLYAMVAARSKGDKNSIVRSAAMYIHELKCAREQLQRRNAELKDRILGHDARQPSVKVDFEVDDPVSGIDSMVGALRRLKSMGVKARGIRSTMAGAKLWTEMNIETTIAACEVERAVEEALTDEVERNTKRQVQADSDSGAAPFPGTTTSGSSNVWGPPQAAATHVQNVF